MAKTGVCQSGLDSKTGARDGPTADTQQHPTSRPPAGGCAYPDQQRGEDFGSPQDLGLRRQSCTHNLRYMSTHLHLPYLAESTP